LVGIAIVGVEQESTRSMESDIGIVREFSGVGGTGRLGARIFGNSGVNSVLDIGSEEVLPVSAA